MRGAVAQVPHLEPGQAVLAQGEDDVVAEAVDSLEHDALPVRDDLCPALASRALHRRPHQAEVPSGVVRAQVEEAAVVLEVVLLLVEAGSDEPQLPLGVARREHPRLARRQARRGEHQECPAAGPIDADAERGVRLFVDERVGRASERVPEEAVLPPGGLVLDGVEERPVVGGPRHRPDAAGHALQHPPGLEALHEQRVVARARVVDRVGQQPPVVAHLEGAEREVAPSLGELVEVEDDLLGGLPPAASRRQRIGYCRASSVRE